ncbi:hypothetical protein HXX76_011347 [Chlamydomonas incerta]|uniref:Glucosidase 2 subunit beta n=1 Tax=Chlamydomonas incerta TaxID=51695 RepID=A0A835SP09_CHLIN|nr:hypothetical protein HXX76_011347 [Chlamydomonas incerta]|eukprot:KAG2428642.1 hypothetical protein HXX76_011347 [Chlamydomonas incerta]
MRGSVALLLLAGLALGVHGQAPIRGLNPDLAAHYSGAGGTFTCISGGKTIPFKQVNDDYCDCADGSDEPGTPACHNGRFYCRNLGHEPKLLAAAFVDDGVCDCCDGSDEAKGNCTNTCLQASAAHRESLKNDIAQYEQALATKADFISRARAFKHELQTKAATIDQDYAAAQAEVERLKGEVSRLEAEESAQRAAEEAQRAADQAAQEQAAAAAAEHQELNTGSDGHAERELQEEGQQASEEREETPEERGRRIASQWTNDPEAAGVAGSQEHVNEGEEQEQEHHGDYSHQDQHDHEEYNGESGEYHEPRPDRAEPEALSEWEDLMMFVGLFKEWGLRWWHTLKTVFQKGIRDEVLAHRERQRQRVQEASTHGETSGRRRQRRARAVDSSPAPKQARRQRSRPATTPSQPAAAPADVSTPLGEVRARLYDAEGTLREAERDKQRIATYLYGNLDFGPEDVFLGLADQCFTSSQTRWTYEACIFKQAVQREGYSNSVTVGRWAGFSSDYKTMLFTGGDECWNVGPRSFTVAMSCGYDNQLSDGEEPATCAYSAKFTSPALCNDEELIGLRNKLAALEAFEREVAEKIAKDEL